MVKMTFARADDWVGIYVDDALITEGHSIYAEAAARIAIEHDAEVVESRDVDLDWIHYMGNLPALIEDVVWA